MRGCAYASSVTIPTTDERPRDRQKARTTYLGIAQRNKRTFICSNRKSVLSRKPDHLFAHYDKLNALPPASLSLTTTTPSNLLLVT